MAGKSVTFDILANDKASQVFDKVGQAAETSSKDVKSAADATDHLASKSSIATGALGALGSGFALVGGENSKYAAALGSAALATDFLSGVGDSLTLVLESTKVKMVAAKIATVGKTIAEKAATVASKAMAAAQWALNAAMSANPIGLVVLAIVALVAIFVVAYKKSETFRSIVTGAFSAVKDAAGAVKDWVVNKFTALVTFFSTMPGKIAKVAGGMWDGIKGSFTGVINFLIDAWNSLDFGIHIQIPDWVPGVGGKGLDIDDIIPDIPRLATGGVVKARPGGVLALLGEGGHDEAVIPLTRPAGPAGPSGGFLGTVEVVVKTEDGREIQRKLLRVKRELGGAALGIA